MVELDLRSRALAICFSGVAGFVDVVGFLASGGFFVSFMSGNSTRLGVGLADEASTALVPAGLILTFVSGVVAGASAGRVAGRFKQVAILTLVTGLLVLALLAHWSGLDDLIVVPLALAMGAQNTVFAEEGDVRVGLTYMTGTLVKLGKRITAALWGGPLFGWVWFLALWLGLLLGVGFGGICYARFGASALVVPVVAMLLLIALSACRRGVGSAATSV
jgi:uncharacterized membrane protein YoaK (UPF0700 family)